MKILDNTRITTKIISLLAMLGLLTVAVAWIGSGEVRKSDAVYSVLVEELTANIKLTQVNRRLAVMNGAAYKAVMYDGASAQAEAAVAEEKEAYDSSLIRLATAEKTMPSVTAEIAEFRSGLMALH